MEKRKTFNKTVILIICLFLLVTILPVQSMAYDDTDSGVAEGMTLDDLAGKTAGVMTGTPQDEIIKAAVNDPDLLYFNNFTDMALALQSGKIDYYINSTISFRIMQDTYPDFDYVNEPLKRLQMGAIFQKNSEGEALCEEFNAYIETIQEDGTLEELQNYWLYPNDWEQVDIPEDGEKGVLHIAVSSSTKPFCFVKDGEYVGFDIAVVAGFCSECGYGLQLEDTDLGSAVSAVAAGKCDLAASQISWTEERAKSVLFSDLYCEQELVAIIRDEDKPDVPSANASAPGNGSASEDQLEYNTIADLKNVKVFGAVTGSVADQYTKEVNPNAEIKYYNSLADEALALENGMIDSFLFDRPTLEYLLNSYPDLGMVSDNLFNEDYCFFLPKSEKGESLQKEFNSWLKGFRDSGELEKMKQFWCSAEEDVSGHIDTSVLTGENGTLNVIYSIATRPDIYYYNGQPAGMPVDLIIRFCQDEGYGIDFLCVNMDALVASTTSGKGDIAIGFYSQTEERAKSVLFTDGLYSGGVTAVVRKTAGTYAKASGSGEDKGIWESIVSSFQRTLLDENRWQMILSGLGVTLIITLFGFILANFLGALFCSMAMSSKTVLRGIADVYSRIMQGTPIVVILMILYYIVFSKIQLSGAFVAVIGFGITSGAYLAQLFQGAIEGVDKGQNEAALAIGFTKKEAFLNIVLPQAIRTMLPGYFSELISLMKGTAIVGYIAVMDLTKVGDVIRSSTFEPFFPLIVTAVIYFGIACILLSVLKCVQKKLAPKRVKNENEGGVSV